MTLLNRDGVNIYFEDNGQGPPVLLTHGYASTSHMWGGEVSAMSGDYRLMTWDMRGHGNTDSPEAQAQYSEASTIDDMAGILRQCGVDKAVIGGHSLGGYMSLAFSLKYPEMTRAIILLGSGPGYRNPKSREGWNKTAVGRAERFEEHGLEAAGSSAEVDTSRHRSAAGLAKAARGMLAQFDSRVMESLPHIPVPTLVLVGERDTPFLAGNEYMAKKIPGATSAVISAAGHAANIDQPAAFQAAVREFLSGLD